MNRVQTDSQLRQRVFCSFHVPQRGDVDTAFINVGGEIVVDNLQVQESEIGVSRLLQSADNLFLLGKTHAFTFPRH
jgi:hypothetical protein